MPTISPISNDLRQYRRPATSSPETRQTSTRGGQGTSCRPPASRGSAGGNMAKPVKMARKGTMAKDGGANGVIDRANLVAQQGAQMLRSMQQLKKDGGRHHHSNNEWGMGGLLIASSSCKGINDNADDASSVVVDDDIDKRPVKRPPSRKNGTAAGLFTIQRVTDAFERERKPGPLTTESVATLAKRPPSRRGGSARRSNPALLAHINGQMVTGGSWAAPRSRRCRPGGEQQVRAHGGGDDGSSTVGAYISDDEGDDDGILIEDFTSTTTSTVKRPSSWNRRSRSQRDTGGGGGQQQSNRRSQPTNAVKPTNSLLVEEPDENGLRQQQPLSSSTEGDYSSHWDQFPWQHGQGGGEEIPPPNFCADENEFSPPSASSSSCGETVPLSVTTRNGVEPLTIPLRLSNRSTQGRSSSRREQDGSSQQRPPPVMSTANRRRQTRIPSADRAAINDIQQQSRPDTSTGSRGTRSRSGRQARSDVTDGRPQTRCRGSTRGNGGGGTRPVSCSANGGQVMQWSTSTTVRGQDGQDIQVPFSTSLDRQFLGLFAT